MKFLEKLSEIGGWMQIFLCPFLIAVITALFVYFNNPSTGRLIIAVCIMFAGTILGVLFAEKMRKSKKGTMWFVSRTTHSPELDDDKDESPN